MLEQAHLAEAFGELLAQQQKAAELCLELAKKADNPDLRQELEQLGRDQRRHIELTKRLLEIVS